MYRDLLRNITMDKSWVFSLGCVLFSGDKSSRLRGKVFGWSGIF